MMCRKQSRLAAGFFMIFSMNKTPASNPKEWWPGKYTITGDYRGRHKNKK